MRWRSSTVRIRRSDKARLPQEGKDHKEGCAASRVHVVQVQGADGAQAMQALRAGVRGNPLYGDTAHGPYADASSSPFAVVTRRPRDRPSCSKLATSASLFPLFHGSVLACNGHSGLNTNGAADSAFEIEDVGSGYLRCDTIGLNERKIGQHMTRPSNSQEIAVTFQSIEVSVIGTINVSVRLSMPVDFQQHAYWTYGLGVLPGRDRCTVHHEFDKLPSRYQFTERMLSAYHHRPRCHSEA